MDAPRLRINYICPLPSLAGGIKSTRLISEALVRRGHDVRIAFPTRAVPLPSWWRPRSRAKAKRRSESLAQARKNHHLLHSSATLIPVDARTVTQVDVPDADISVASWWECLEWMSQWPERKGARVHYIRGHDVHHKARERAEAVLRSGVAKVTISQWLSEVVRTEYGREAPVVPNGIEWAQFSTPPRSKNREPVVGFLYGVGILKDAATAMRACRLVQESIPELRVVAFGASERLEETELPNNFKYFPRPRQEHIADIYAQTDCWIVSSRSEGLAMPGLEAAACRCPIVATDCGGVTDFVFPGRNGYLVPVGDWRAMAERVREIVSLPDSQWCTMSKLSHDIARRFDWDTSAEQLEQVFFSLLGSRQVQCGEIR